METNYVTFTAMTTLSPEYQWKEPTTRLSHGSGENLEAFTLGRAEAP